MSQYPSLLIVLIYVQYAYVCHYGACVHVRREKKFTLLGTKVYKSAYVYACTNCVSSHHSTALQGHGEKCQNSSEAMY